MALTLNMWIKWIPSIRGVSNIKEKGVFITFEEMRSIPISKTGVLNIKIIFSIRK